MGFSRWIMPVWRSVRSWSLRIIIARCLPSRQNVVKLFLLLLWTWSMRYWIFTDKWRPEGQVKPKSGERHGGREDDVMESGSNHGDSCVLWLPHILILVISSLYVPYVWQQSVTRRNRLYTYLNRLKMLACLVTLLLALLKSSREGLWIYQIVTTVSVVCVCLWCLLETRGGLLPSIMPCLGLILLLAPHVAFVRLVFLQMDNVACFGDGCSASPTFWYILPTLTAEWRCLYVISLKVTFIVTFCVDILTPASYFLTVKHSYQNTDPHPGSSLLSRVTFSWILPHILICQKKELTIADLYQYQDGHGSQETLQALNKIMSKSQQSSKSHKSINNIINKKNMHKAEHNNNYMHKSLTKNDDDPWTKSYSHRDLVLAALYLFRWPILVGIFLHTMATFIQATNVLAMGSLIHYLESDNADTWLGMYLAIRIGFVRIFGNTMNTSYFYMTNYATSRLKGLISSMVVSKYFRLSPRSRAQIGHDVMTYLTSDAQQVGRMIAECNFGYEMLISGPVFVWVMWTHTGPLPCLTGTALLLIVIYVAIFIMKTQMDTLQKETMKKRTHRVNLIQSILMGIKVLKLNAWEESYAGKVDAVRQDELKLKTKASNLGSLSRSLLGVTSYMVTSVTFLIYSLLSEARPVTAEMIFVTLVTTDWFIKFTLALPDFYSALIQGRTSLRRLLNYLDMEELDVNESQQAHHSPQPEVPIRINDGTFSLQEETPLLKSINLSVHQGELVAVVGPVGSGKSLLLSALLHQMYTVTGSVEIHGSVGFCEQEAWILNDTIRENILLGRRYNKTFFNQVIDACDLRQDINTFTHGELTQIGERGVTLSGGQKQRVSLARAIYADTDIYLLDDPLSAVDAKVGAHLFNHVIGPHGMLKHKTRILVTHALQWLPHVDRVVLMGEGEVRVTGQYSDLQHRETFFSTLKTTGQLKPTDPKSVETRLKKDQAKEMGNGACNGHGMLMNKETRERQQSSWTTFMTYLREFGLVRGAFLLLLSAFLVGLRLEASVWATHWSNEWKVNATMAAASNNYRLSGFFFLGIVQGVSVVLITLTLAAGAMTSSQRLHASLLSRLLHASPTFFDTTPSGRIINWFTRDMNDVDTALLQELDVFLLSGPGLIGALVLIVWQLPIIILPCIPLLCLFYFVRTLYAPYAKDLMRIDGESRSLAFSHFTQCIQGIVSIHAYQKHQHFTDAFYSLVDDYNRPYWHTAAAQNFLRMWLSNLAGCLAIVISMMCVFYRDVISPGFAAAIVYSSMNLVWRFNSVFQYTVEMERLLVAVERITGKNNITFEAPWMRDCVVAVTWPSEGRVEFNHYTTRYRPGLNPALTDITFSIKPKEKIGVIGRTGAGKTSLVFALLRLLESERGRITIDNVNIATVGLHQLRSKITLITQDPVLFNANIRDNLDPFGCHGDAKIWQALEHAHLKPLLRASYRDLDTPCGQNGELLSVGERQLLCLARALLRDSKIIILDEPTASIDVHTDDLIQKTLQTSFTQSTIITIAHRLSTVIHYDRILVMDGGRVSEFDTPTRLLATPTSRLNILTRESGLTVPDL